MNEIELSKYIDRIAEAVVILTKKSRGPGKAECIKFKNGHRKQAV